MNIVLWVLQILLAATFGLQGFMKFGPPEGLPEIMAWVYDIPMVFNIPIGIVELAAAFGLILPGLTKIQTKLTPLAATGLVLTMVGAMIFHIARGEFTSLPGNFILGGIAAYVAYARWKTHPLPERGSQ